MDAVVREPAVAGRFYPGDAAELRATVDRLVGERAPAPAFAAMAPHAGYVFSGACAGATFRQLEPAKRVVILAPNHTGRGVPLSVFARGAWKLPGATVPIDAELADLVLAAVPGAQADVRAHEREHAAEVEVPFLLAGASDVSILPIVLAGLGTPQLVAFGEALARVLPDDVFVLASSDMSHYVPDEVARAADQMAIDAILAIDPERLYATVRDHDISMCGVLPATAMLAFVRARAAQLGARAEATLACYATSGEASGDYSSVVGYAGVVVRKHSA